MDWGNVRKLTAPALGCILLSGFFDDVISDYLWARSVLLTRFVVPVMCVYVCMCVRAYVRLVPLISLFIGAFGTLVPFYFFLAD
jgi:hypothetical protein